MFAWTVLICWSFQSTLSVRRATQTVLSAVGQSCISTHALREESDTSRAMLPQSLTRFQSTLSVRRATTGRRI